jgi:TPR repeat protein
MLVPSRRSSFLFGFWIFLGVLHCCSALRAQQSSGLSDSVGELKSRAESGDLSAQMELSEFLLGASPSAEAYDLALNWLRSAAAQDSSHAEFVLGYLCHHGHGVPQDYVQAAHYYQRAVLHGHRVAPNNLAVLYQQGLGVPKDAAKAVELFRTSALRGNPTAQYNLAVAYSSGIGTSRDPHEAAYWFRASADLDFRSAQHALGVLYCKGIGVPLDFSEAARWFALAAHQGYPAAEADLAALYESGRGVSLDYVAAYTWYSRAADAGDPSGPARLQNLAHLMTQKQLDRAKAVLAQSSPSHPSPGKPTDPSFLPGP